MLRHRKFVTVVGETRFQTLAALCTLAVLLMWSSAAYGENIGNRYSFLLHFRFDRSELHKDYKTNASEIARLKDFLNTAPAIDSIVVVSYSSPEGNVRYNNELADRRSQTAEQYMRHLLDLHNINYAIDMRRQPSGENWSGLLKELQAHYHRNNRKAVLDIVASDRSEEAKKAALRRLDRGDTYNYIVLWYMSRLRYTTGIIVYTKPLTITEMQPLRLTAEPVASAVPAMLPPLAAEPAKLKMPKALSTIAAVKTNLLFDAVTAVNVAVEVPLSNKVSALVQLYTPWWLTNDNRKCLQLITLGGEARWWFAPKASPRQGKDHPVGHFLGAYAYSGKTDLQWDNTGRYQADGWSAGLSYGYAMPISRLFNIEFSLAVGYARLQWERYTPSDDWQTLFHEDAGVLDYLGPTKAEVSLVMPLRIKTKGGVR